MPKVTCLRYVLLATTLSRAFAATTHTVIVGVEGSFYDPPTTSAQQGDTVTFIFGGDAHTVTQSTFDDPCSPLAGGFNSGFQGRGMNFDNPVTSWDLIIQNASEPIWFFCAASIPSPHCAAGMVGAINPPSNAMFSNFTAAAKLVTTTGHANATPILTGVGAFATGTPAITSVPMSEIMSTPSATSSSTSASASSAGATSGTVGAASSTPTSAAISGGHHTNLGAIVGGVVGGVTVLLVFLAFVLWYRKNHSSSTTFTNYPAMQQHRGGPFQNGRERMQELPYEESQPPLSPALVPSRKASASSGQILQPQRLTRQEMLESQLSKQSSFTSAVDNASNIGGQLGTGTITDRSIVLQALAQEVATVLQQGGGGGNGDTQPNSRPLPAEPKLVPNRPRGQSDGSEIGRVETPAPPPNYRAALNSIPPSW